MIILFPIIALLLGIGIGFLLSKRVLQKKFQEDFDASLSASKEELEGKNKEVLELKQRLADTSYKCAELEKDNRSLSQQLERHK